MLYCHDCGEYFEEPRKVRESRGEFWGAPAYETMYYCPCCGSSNFDDDYPDEFDDCEEDE